MEFLNQLQVALKEWASVCRALEDGRQILLLRKGGIHESEGKFELEHGEFLLFPTYLHQNLAMLKPSEHASFVQMTAEPEAIALSAAARVTDIVRIESRSQMDALDDQHIWTPPLIDMRFNYRPSNPLYLLIVRVWRLDEPVTIVNSPAYAGCKSWVPLEKAIAAAGTAVMDDGAYGARREMIRRRAGLGDGVAASG